MTHERETPGLFSALLLGLLVNVLLRTRAAYWPRAGAAAALLCVPLLAAAAWAFAKGWRSGRSPLLRLLFAALLLFAAALELLRMRQLIARLYPASLGMAAVCLVLLLPVIYLRRGFVIAQSARVVLCLLAAAGCVMLLSLLPRLHWTNLQMRALTSADYAQAATAQLILYPEYLLPALWPQRKKGRCPESLRLSATALCFDVAVHLLLELFYGAALPLRTDPLHAAARCGALSVFARMEWLQLLLWMMAVTLKLAVYLYAVAHLLRIKNAEENTAAGLRGAVLYFAALAVLCAFLRKVDLDALARLRNIGTWGLAVLVWMGGAAAWLCRIIRRRAG